jgi:carbonic anhydrase/acetyltransferase-like protein (isoleucine patch superfamily)
MAIYEHMGVRPTLGKDVFVAPNATVIGDVHLGDESSVWFGAVIRGDVFPIRFGVRTNVQDGSVVHVTGGQAATTVGDDVTIGHMVLLHGCTIGDRCLIGMGSIVLDGAEIGDECLIAAGTLVAPRTKIPPRSMVMGRPGKAVRALGEKDLAMVREAGRLYVGYAATFRSDRVKLVER